MDSVLLHDTENIFQCQSCVLKIVLSKRLMNFGMKTTLKTSDLILREN